MEILTNFSNYDTGYFIYDLWTIIVITTLCSAVLLFVNAGLKKERSVGGFVLIVSIVMVVAQVSVLSTSLRGVFLLAALLLLFRKKKESLLVVLICSLIGFGYTILPISIALLMTVLGVFVNRKREQA